MPHPDARWDTDERGRGVGSAEAFLEAADALREHMARPDWVAEDPEQHLLPHLRQGFDIREWRVVDGALEVDLAWRGERSPGAIRAAVFALIGTVAEAATLVRAVGDDLFEVVTGQLDGDGSFAAHGHTLRLRVLNLADRPV